MGAREAFLEKYNKMPITMRRDTIFVFENEPINWNKLFVEVLNETEKAETILKKLKEVNLI